MKNEKKQHAKELKRIKNFLEKLQEKLYQKVSW